MSDEKVAATDIDLDNIRRVNSVGPMPKNCSLDNTPAGQGAIRAEKEFRRFANVLGSFCQPNDCY
jgi:hypothetical protein